MRILRRDQVIDPSAVRSLMKLRSTIDVLTCQSKAFELAFDEKSFKTLWGVCCGASMIPGGEFARFWSTYD